MPRSRLFPFFILLIAACSPKKESDSVTLAIFAPSYAKTEAKILITNVINVHDSILAAVSLDSTGAGSLKFKLTQPTFAILMLPGRWNPVYFEPGDNLVVRVGETNAQPTRYSGQGSEANNYISQTAAIRFNIENAQRSNQNMKVAEIVSRLDTLKRELLDFHQHYRDSVPLPVALAALLEKRNEIMLLSEIQRAGWNLKARTGASEVPAALNVVGKIPVDSSLLQLALIDYILLHQLNMELEYYMPLSATPSLEKEKVSGSLNDEELLEKCKREFPPAVKKMIDGQNQPLFLKEFQNAKNVNYWMATFGLTPSVDSLYRQFKREFPSSVYTSTLQSQFNQWMALSPGRPAPDFSGFTTDGKKVALSDLKGKAVYIDVWATWCAPCVAEIPFSKKLQKKFSPNDPVVFLNVSVDQNQVAWKKMVLADAGWKGTHIVVPPVDGPSPVMSKYMIWGIPRFMLIDRSGNIASADAPRPSTGDVIAEKINSLIRQ